MDLLTRSEAIERGSKTYFTGIPCPRGHLCERYVSDRKCRLCGIERVMVRQKANPQKVKIHRQKADIKRHPYRVADEAKRRAKRQKACPAWADHDAIRALYEDARRLTLETGVVYHVDHIYPLRGKYVSGLHVANNMRVIPATDNIAKSNRVIDDP